MTYSLAVDFAFQEKHHFLYRFGKDIFNGSPSGRMSDLTQIFMRCACC
jgi:hypothetical protein